MSLPTNATVEVPPVSFLPTVTHHGYTATNYIVLSVPMFFVSIAVEMAVSWWKQRRLYRLNDTVSSLSCGVFSEVFPAFLKMITVWPYAYVWENYALFRFPADSALAWGLMFLMVDFGYYWFHRLSHECNLLWAAHQTHHSSEEYNLSTALRQSAFQRFFSWAFYVPFALFLPPELAIVHIQWNIIFQFWIHTRLIDRLGPLELILMTPSHHRVHHGRNEQYLDKNYGGTLILFDMLFGTFEPEKEDVVFGLVHPLQQWNVLVAEFCHFEHIVRSLFQLQGWRRKIGVVLRGPGWNPVDGSEYPVPAVDAATAIKFDKNVPREFYPYVLVHFTITVAVSFTFLAQLHNFPTGMASLVALFFIFSLTCHSALFDLHTWCLGIELARLVGATALTIFVLGWMSPVAKSVMVLSLGSFVWMVMHRAAFGKKLKAA